MTVNILISIFSRAIYFVYLMKQAIVYIVTNRPQGVLYVGVTSNLIKRIYEHKHAINSGFSSRYNCQSLVYYELCSSMDNAIAREKQIKSGSRKKKIELINSMNPDWVDLYSSVCF